ncbi:hypothetical protein Goklo_026410 [Gossypium klotzschianum]|uniref:Uncharacterized protein n=1 Tax=Gossypium klotzschianum TaxID=34286 RepID=A0A7J8TUZ3_9ROSI|nr:hypothetical protein [Gossypium klotzschianum]
MDTIQGSDNSSSNSRWILSKSEHLAC